MQKKKNSRNP